MSLVGGAEDAEAVAQDWLKRRYAKRFGRVRFEHIMLEGGTWELKGNLEFRGGILAQPKRKVLLKISSETTQVVGYTELQDGK